MGKNFSDVKKWEEYPFLGMTANTRAIAKEVSVNGSLGCIPTLDAKK